ncbi:hypothetical protein ACFPK1_12215 [Actinomycetospora rhizophila]|uniref:DUF5667 domain-containing protein n=1 Tax=Actinomycetospora rhizophila TaxID=1416876 RepID=A0ABV9ZD46_9PSEU
MPGWRGYLPDGVDRSRRKSAGPAVLHPGPRRVVALGALAACAVAAGAALQTRPDGPPDRGADPAEDGGSALARSSAWTREATPVLASIETELRRTDEVRARWDGSSLARRAPSTPGAVVALVDRRAELAHHRDGLRAALATVRSAPGSEAALVVAWPRLRAAQELLHSLSSARGELGDPVEAAVLRLVLDEQVQGPSGAPPGRGTGADTVRVALASTASAVEQPAVSAVSTVSALPSVPAVSAAPAEVPETVAAAPAVAAAAPAPEVTDDAPEDAAPRTAPVTPDTVEVVADEAPEPSMLSFDRSPSDATTATAEPEEPEQEPEQAGTGVTDADPAVRDGSAGDVETGTGLSSPG